MPIEVVMAVTGRGAVITGLVEVGTIALKENV